MIGFYDSLDTSEIVNWADKPSAADVLPGARPEVDSGDHDLPESLDIPSGSSVRMPGWDGLLSVSEGNPWIPSGVSAWEFSCEKTLSRKRMVTMRSARKIRKARLRLKRHSCSNDSEVQRQGGMDEWVSARRPLG